jgi:glycosyltransferase involved in cell wall biosynthesis
LDNSGLNHQVLSHWRPVVDADLPDADVVIATWWETAEWVYRLSKSKGTKAYLVQGHEVFANMPIDRVKATYRLPMRKIVVSAWLKRIMEREYGVLDVDLVPNSVDHAQFYAAVRGKQGRPTLGFLYSGSSSKGVDIALDVIRRLRSRISNLRVVSFGAVPLDANQIWDSSIEYEHSPAQDRLREIYAQCDVWLSTSRSEGFNLTAMEAMACRTPVVSTRTGWPEEAIQNHVNGALADIDDVEGLLSGALWVLSLSESEWRTASTSAYETAAAGSWQQSADLFESLLQRWISSGGE